MRARRLAPRPLAAGALLLFGTLGALGNEPPAAGPGEAAATEAPAPANGAPSAAFPATRPPMPFDVMRSVQFLQDQVAHGNDRAIRVQALLLRRFARSFLQADPAIWSDPRNQRAAALFALSGGPPDLLVDLKRESLLGALPAELVDGAIAYGRNDLENAGRRLAALDLGSLEPVLAAQTAMALGQIRQIEDPAAAAADLDRARLLAPGTLLEEAALRLQTLLVDDLGQHGRADHLARRYFSEFNRSAYAGNFETRFVAMMTARGRSDADMAMAAMADAVAPLDPERRRTLFLAAARRSLVEGELRFAGRAAASAEALPGASDADRTRAELYAAASGVATADPGEAARRLGAIRREALHPADQPLLDAALAVLRGIDETATPLASLQTGDGEPAAPVAGASTLARAQQALADASQDLSGQTP